MPQGSIADSAPSVDSLMGLALRPLVPQLLLRSRRVPRIEAEEAIEAILLREEQAAPVGVRLSDQVTGFLLRRAASSGKLETATAVSNANSSIPRIQMLLPRRLWDLLQ